MESIDQPNFPDPQKVSYRQHAIRSGLYISAATIVLGLVAYVTGLSETMMHNTALRWTNNLLTIGIVVGVVYYACQQHRNDDLGGYISVSRCLGLGTLSGLISGVIGAIWGYIFISYIAPDMMDAIRDMAMQDMTDRGLSEEDAEKQMQIMSFFFSPAFFFVAALIGSVLYGFIGGVVSGFALKRERPI